MRGIISAPLAICVVVVCVYSTIARVDWQYTRWGMTVQEAVNASGGQLKLCQNNECKTARTMQLEPRAFGLYQSAEFKFISYLLFDAQGKLSAVKLHMADKAKELSLLAAMRDKYGPPSGQENSPHYTVRLWRTPSEEVSLLTWSGDAVLMYKPVPAASSKGL
jgi:hypothetical protein